MKRLVRAAFVLGVLGGIAWVLYRFAPEMMEQCQRMTKERETLGDEVGKAIEEELAEAQV